MALFDFLADAARGANSALGDVPSQVFSGFGGPQLSPLMKLAIPALVTDQIVRLVNKKRDRPSARAGAWRTFGQLGLAEMLRPQQIRDELIKSRIVSGELTGTAREGQKPTETYGGVPLYEAERLRDIAPEAFVGKTTPGEQLPPPYRTGELGPTTTGPVPPGMAMIGGLPATIQSRMGLAEMWMKQELERAKTRAFRPGSQIYNNAGEFVGAIPGSPGAITKAGLAQERYKDDPKSMDEFLLGGGGAGKAPAVRNMPVTTADGKELTIPHQFNPETNAWEPIPDLGGSRFNPNDPVARIQLQAMQAPLLETIKAANKKMQMEGRTPAEIQEYKAQIRAAEKQIGEINRAFGLNMPPVSMLSPDVEEQGKQYLDSLLGK